MASKRVCIVGTAESWRQTPFNDLSIDIWSLNDAYALGLPRANAWFEQHPFGKMFFHTPGVPVHPKDIPQGAYIRPAGHLEWLKTQAAQIPVYLQETPPVDWPANAQRFPIEMVTEQFGESYWAAGPSYMLAWAVMKGYTEIWITGIHLATQHEYMEQRPQFENLIGRLLGRTVKEHVENGFRFYDGDVRIVLPVSSPIMQHGWRYAYQPKPVAPESPYADELHRTQKQKAKLANLLIRGTFTDRERAAALEELDDLEVIEIDCQQMLGRMRGCGTLTATLGA